LEEKINEEPKKTRELYLGEIKGSSIKDNRIKREKQGSLQIWTRSKTNSLEREMVTFSNNIINDES